MPPNLPCDPPCLRHAHFQVLVVEREIEGDMELIDYCMYYSIISTPSNQCCYNLQLFNVGYSYSVHTALEVIVLEMHPPGLA